MPRGYPINREEALAKRSKSNKRYADLHKIEPIFRFWQFVSIQEDGCWLWTGGVSDNGYAHFWLDGRTVKAHRFAYVYFRGEPIPDGLEPDHLCRNRSCVNPWHLEPVTHPINCQRGEGSQFQRDKDHCPHGHPYNEENTYRRPGRPQRNCKICRREVNDRWRKKQKESLGMMSQAQAG